MPTSRSKNKVIGITLGDPAGIGPEVAAKALHQKDIRSLAHFVIIGSAHLFAEYFPRRYAHCTFVGLDNINRRMFCIGHPGRWSAQASLDYLNKAVAFLKSGRIQSLVTAPVCKEAICEIDPAFYGHTEFLAKAFDVKNVGMMFVCDDRRVILVTRHIPLHQVSALVTEDLVDQTIRLAHEALENYFQLRRPVIAVCGLNPHAGEGGVLGTEEIRKIIPAIRRSRRRRWDVRGPFAADTLFSPATGSAYDAVVAMYHDQGLIPVKTMYFKRLVNLTVGLPFIRTSPAHGTAFDIAGKNKADASSMAEAIKLAARLTP